jgi:gluconate kinase
VVVILMSAAGAGAAAIGRALAQEVGWPLVHAPDPHALHAIVARTLGRREHAVVISVPLTATDQEIVRGDLHGVRFVDLAQPSGSDADTLRTIRREFGL